MENENAGRGLVAMGDEGLKDLAVNVIIMGAGMSHAGSVFLASTAEINDAAGQLSRAPIRLIFNVLVFPGRPNG